MIKDLHDETAHSCEIMGPTGAIVQLTMAFCAFLILICNIPFHPSHIRQEIHRRTQKRLDGLGPGKIPHNPLIFAGHFQADHFRRPRTCFECAPRTTHDHGDQGAVCRRFLLVVPFPFWFNPKVSDHLPHRHDPGTLHEYIFATLGREAADKV